MAGPRVRLSLEKAGRGVPLGNDDETEKRRGGWGCGRIRTARFDSVPAMTRSVLDDAYGHHVWATLELIDACSSLSAEQLETSVTGTYGSILDTMRHLVGADRSYLFVISGGRAPLIDDEEESTMGLPDLRKVMEENGSIWPEVVAGHLDPDADYVRPQDDGSLSHAPLGVRLAQVVHHGSDHRSQICTALTSIVEPPEIDVWDYAEKDGRISMTPPGS
jgi:uncharacterized damage-inducible protein DinB